MVEGGNSPDMDDTMTSAADVAEVYRRADLRLRLLLLGDGADTPPIVRGKDHGSA